MLLLVGLVVLVAVGFNSTRSLVRDGLDRFTGAERVAAEDALSLAYGCLDHPIQRSLTPKLQVADMDLEPGYCPIAGTHRIPAYRAEVRTYTLFMIPTGTLSVDCGSVHCLGQPDLSRY